MKSFPGQRLPGRSHACRQLRLSFKGQLSETTSRNGLEFDSGTRHSASSVAVSAAKENSWSLGQAGALVATSLQQAVNKSISEATPVLQDLLGSRAKAGGSSTASALPAWRPLKSAKSVVEGISAVQRRNSDVVEKKKADEAVKLLQSQAAANSAFNLLKTRAKSNSQPGQRSDNFKLGLVVEGGGMRGASSAGSLQALHDLGLRDCFDAVYGSSAGACNATYFLSGQRHGADIYAQHISNTDFIDLRRLYSRAKGDTRAALNLPYLLDYVMNEVQPLDWQAVVDSPVPLKIVASCLDSLQPLLLEKFVDEHDLRECLRASAAVPVVAGMPVLHRGRRLVDAAVFEAIPLRAAVADGCTHCIVLPTRPPFKKADYVARWIDDAVSRLVIKAVLSPAYMKDAWVKEMQYARSFGVTSEELLVQSLEPNAHSLPGLEGVHVFPVFPGPASSYSPMCIDPATVMLGVAEGRNAVLQIFGSLSNASCPLPLVSTPVQKAIPSNRSTISRGVKVHASS